MKKIIHPYDIKIGEYYRPVFCEMEYNDGNLSISGVEGPTQSGNAYGSFGQIRMSPEELKAADIRVADGWKKYQIRKLFYLWKQWHLNDMQPACEHQRAWGWDYEHHRGMFREHPRKIVLIDEYDDGTANDSLLKWDEYKGHECPICGYSIGSAWLKMVVPQDVIDWLFSRPNTDRHPAWV